MKILLSPDVYLRLSVASSVVGSREMSGYGFIEKDGEDFKVYDIVLLDVGNSSYTEFDSKKILEVLQREDANAMKLWWHKHPLGNGKPGPHNWSGTDNATCLNEPLGCPDPDNVGWALAMVLTPGGWVGRIDQFKNNKHKTTHMSVEVNLDWSITKTARQLLKEQEETEKKVTYEIPKYWTEIDDEELDDKFETAHVNLDEGFQVIQIADYQITDGFFREADMSIEWAEGIANKYKCNAYVKHRATKLLQDVKKQKRRLRKRLERKTRGGSQ